MSYTLLNTISTPLVKAKPFLKWAGGKSQLLEQFQDYYPAELKLGKIKKYFEPFLGGGAVFLDIVKKFKINKAYLTDINEELIIAYKVIQRAPETLIEYLKKFSRDYHQLSEEERKEYFYDVRLNYNLNHFQISYKKYSKNWIPRTAQMIFLNKTCFNGLFRVNQKGEFNVPFGKYKNPKILNEQNIISLSNILQIAEINVGDFKSTEHLIDENSFIYFDPPYRPISKTASFTSYAQSGFNDDEQIRLGKYFAKLDREKNARLMLSNSDPTNENPDDSFFEELFKGYNINRVFANRMINCNGGQCAIA